MDCVMENLDLSQHLKGEEYLEFLKNKLNQISEDDDYNIYLHQIGVEYKITPDLNVTLVREMLNIYQNGLGVNGYGSITGNTNGFGLASEVDPEKIAGYQYDKFYDFVIVAILAMPKFVDIDGKRLEFSSYNGECARNNCNILDDVYKECKINRPLLDHYKFCLFDAVKDSYMPRGYLLGFQVYSKTSQEVIFVDPHTHISEKSAEEKKQLNDYFANKIKGLYQKYDTTQTGHVIAKAYQAEERFWEALREMDI